MCKVYCGKCKYYIEADGWDYEHLDVMPPRHSCKFNANEKITFTDTPIHRIMHEDIGWHDCEKVNKNNDCPYFKKA